MKRIIFFSLVLLYLSGCKKDDLPNNIGDSSTITPIDLSLGKSWKYSWYALMVSDSGIILTSDIDTFVVRIASINDTLNNLKDLIRFEAYSLTRFVGISSVWYQYKGESFVEVAYKNISNDLVFPRIEKKSIATSKSSFY